MKASFVITLEYQHPLTEATLNEFGALGHAAVDEVMDRPMLLDTIAYANSVHLWLMRASGRPVGFCAMFVLPDPRTRQMTATQDAIYVSPPFRGRLGATLISLVDKALLDLGVEIVYRQAPSSRDLGPLYLRLGYEPAETVYARRLGGQGHAEVGGHRSRSRRNCRRCGCVRHDGGDD